MRILRIQPEVDSPDRYNYRVNYGVWDYIRATKLRLSKLRDINDDYINSFDIVFLPMYKRWQGYGEEIDRLKSLPIKTVLFDNDTCYRSFSDPFYDGIDFIFYRIKDRDGMSPNSPSAQLLWSVDTNYFTPIYGGNGVSFNCTVSGGTYSLREQISKHIAPTNHIGQSYVYHLQNSAAGIHTNSQIAPIPRAKMLEFASCGTEIISNRMEGINDYFPFGLVTYFDTVPELLEIVKNFEPNIEIQKELRKIVEEKHSDKQRAQEVIDILYEKVFN